MLIKWISRLTSIPTMTFVISCAYSKNDSIIGEVVHNDLIHGMFYDQRTVILICGTAPQHSTSA